MPSVQGEVITQPPPVRHMRMRETCACMYFCFSNSSGPPDVTQVTLALTFHRTEGRTKATHAVMQTPRWSLR
jgi:hypothetical protein